MLALQPTSLFKQSSLFITIIFWSFVIASTIVFVCSYKAIYQYVKLIILIGTDSNKYHSLNTLVRSVASLHSLAPDLELQLTEFALDLNDMFTAYWKGPALLPSLAIIASTYFYPYLKVLIYLIVYFIPLRFSYQMGAQFVVWQLNKIMFIPLVAVCLQSVTFSFDIVLPTEELSSNTDTDTHAEAYPGTGLLINIIIIICYACCDYMLCILIRRYRQKYIVASEIKNYDTYSDIERRRKRYTPTSYIGIFCRAIFLSVIIGNIWLLLEAQMSAPVGLKIDGVLANVVPDQYRTNNIFETGRILLTTSLLNDVTAYFLYTIYMTVFVICPCIVTVLLVMIWIAPLFHTQYGFGIVSTYGVKLLWFVQSWNALDVFLLCHCGATQANIKNTTKYLLDSRFPQFCGASGIVEQVFNEDCSWADAWFASGITFYVVTVIIQWFAMFYTTKIFGMNKRETSKRCVNT